MEDPGDFLPHNHSGSRSVIDPVIRGSLYCRAEHDPRSLEECMPAPKPRLAPALSTFLVLAVLLPAGISAAVEPEPGPMSAGRAHAIRAALTPTEPPLSQLEALQSRRAPESLSLVVVGFDFSDSLMWGRDLDDFEGWPPQTRESRRIPGTDIHVFAAHDSTYFDLQIRRVDAYLRTVSFGAFSMDWAVHGEIRNVPRPMSWFADPDSGTVRLARVAQDLADAIDDDVDFTGVDTFVLVHAGAGAETDIDGNSPEQIPSTYLDASDLADAVEAGLLADPWISTAEGVLEHVLVLPESETQDPIAGVPGSGFFDVRGVYCFEFGLRLGMLSLADFTPSGFPDSQGIGNFGLMGYGLFTGLGIVPAAPSAINRMLMGWADPVEVRGDADLRIAPMIDPAVAAGDTNLVRVPVSDREYWLLEYRLQDPDGDLFYGFDDLNANFVPDYYDASNAANGGVPNSTFDPLEDSWEDEAGAEVDFFMSENPARTPDGCRRGGGSGLYIWHIDEQVIENALLAGTNTINANPRHKGVDVEEADGIQDLDSPFSGLWLLGGDQDVWRGEGQPEFGPETAPSTASNAGLDTGIRFTDFSTVVAESLPKAGGFCTGFEYADAMRVRVEFGANATGPVEQVRLRMDGYGPQFDLRSVDVGTSPASPAPDGVDEIVAVADSGRVFVFNGDLTSFDVAAAEPGLLAVATAGDSLEWTGPPAVSRFDDDERYDVIAGSNAGPFGFQLDGDELVDGDADPTTFGRLADPLGEGIGPVVVDFHARQVVQQGADLGLVSVGIGPFDEYQLLRGEVVADARGAGQIVLVGGPGIFAGYEREGELRKVSWDATWSRSLPEAAIKLDAPAPDGYASAPAVLARTGAPGGESFWADPEGRIVAGPTEVERAGFVAPGPRSSLIVAPTHRDGPGVVVAFTTKDGLYALDANLSILPGFPARVRGNIAIPLEPRLVEPVAVDLDGDDRLELIWIDGAGGIHATDLEGRELSGWPIQGPATPASAPALGQFDDDAPMEMVVAGRFERLVTGTDEAPGFVSRATGELRVYELQAPASAYAPWPQALGGTTNRANQSLEAAPATGSGLVDDSFSVRPNPAPGNVVRLRADAAGGVEARLDIYTLEGERVLSQGPFQVPAGTALDIEFRIDGLGSGTYICQLTSGGTVQRRILAVVR
jgi:M6 family metalloprotease-like protein